MKDFLIVVSPTILPIPSPYKKVNSLRERVFKKGLFRYYLVYWGIDNKSRTATQECITLYAKNVDSAWNKCKKMLLFQILKEHKYTAIAPFLSLPDDYDVLKWANDEVSGLSQK